MDVQLYASDIERTILASLLLFNEEKNTMIAMLKLKPEHFYFLVHQKIYKEIENFNKKNIEFEITLMIDKLKEHESYLIELMDVATVPNIENHINIIINWYKKRELYTASLEVIRDIQTTDYNKLIENYDKKIFNLASESGDIKIKPLEKYAGQFFEDLELRLSGNDDKILTGFKSLDNLIGGIHKGEFVVIGARPGNGKTSLGLNIASNVVKYQNRPVLFFSLEMTGSQIIERELAGNCLISKDNLRRGPLTSMHLGQMSEEINKWENNEAKIYVCTERVNIKEITVLSKQFIKRFPNTGLIITDYIQRIEDQGRYNGDQRLETNAKSTGLANLAKETGVPNIGLAQLNRNLEGRKEKKPILADLKESGKIEEDANIVLFIHRGQKYGEEGKTELDADVIVAKSRESDTGFVEMKFEGQFAKFFDIEKKKRGNFLR